MSHEKQEPMTALCHPERKHLARGLCTQCYQNWSLRAHLHPNLQPYVDRFAEIKAERSRLAGEKRTARKPRRAYNRNYRLEKRYGLTENDYQQMKDEQNGVCAICEQEHQQLYVDHCHTTGRVRKLLCPRCNTLVGFLETGPVSKAFQYIAYESRKRGTDDRPAVTAPSN